MSLKSISASDVTTPNRLPPGPRGLPLLGFLGLLPFRGRSPSGLGLEGLAREFGDVCHFQAGPLPAVVISHPDLIAEAFAQAESLCPGAARPNLTSHLASDDMGSAAGNRWLELDRFARERLFGPRVLDMLRSRHLEPMVDDLVDRLAEVAQRGKTIAPLADFESLEFNLTFRIIFGSSSHDSAEFLSLKSQLREILGWSSLMSGAANPPDLLSWLKRLAKNLEREAAVVRPARERVLAGLLEGVRRRPAIDSPEPACLADILLAAHASGDLAWPEVLGLCGDSLEAAPTGLGKTLSWLLLLLANRPEVQGGVHEELDRVVGWGANPRTEDRVRLPWTFASIAESMRYRTATPLTRPCRAPADMATGGFHIPAGSLLLGNIHSIHHDERFWEAPGRFQPERFLAAGGSAPKALGFGALMSLGGVTGPRAGGELAEDSVWLFASRLLGRLRFDLPGELPLPEEAVNGLAISPRPFQLALSLRW